jgi:hypothetical protein
MGGGGMVLRSVAVKFLGRLGAGRYSLGVLMYKRHTRVYGSNAQEY